MAKWLKLYVTDKLCHRTTLLNTDVLNFYITLEFTTSRLWVRHPSVEHRFTETHHSTANQSVLSTLSQNQLRLGMYFRSCSESSQLLLSEQKKKKRKGGKKEKRKQKKGKCNPESNFCVFSWQVNRRSLHNSFEGFAIYMLHN